MMLNGQENGTLPDYGNPPVVETILGVQFDRLPAFKNAHLGAFWKTLDPSEWPTVSDAPPLLPQFEQFTESARWAIGLQIQMTQELLARVQIKNREGNRLIQVQNGRFHFNWLGQAGGQYPHYGQMRQKFSRVLERFLEFLAQEKLGDFRPNQWEVTYLNHIPKGSVWNSPCDWGFFRALGAVPTIEGLVQGESFNGEWHFIIPEKRGRLHVQWQHAKKPDPDEQEIVVLTLTARGPLEPKHPDLQFVLAGLDLGHETIVRSFEKFMSAAANKFWGLEHAKD